MVDEARSVPSHGRINDVVVIDGEHVAPDVLAVVVPLALVSEALHTMKQQTRRLGREGYPKASIHQTHDPNQARETKGPRKPNFKS